jgi:hypothetical protein
MFSKLNFGVLLLVAQVLVANASPAPVHVELFKRTCIKRRSPGDLAVRNECTTTITTCPVTPTTTTTTTTTATEVTTTVTTTTETEVTVTTTTVTTPSPTTTTVTEVTTEVTTTVTTVTTPSPTTTTVTEVTTIVSTTCPPTTPPGKCEVGTAFGNAPCCSTPLNAAPAICTRWGWYITGTATTTFPITGTLWVGAGMNDLSKGTNVGSFTITKSGTSYTITYSFKSGFSAAEVHIYAACTKPTTCAPGQFNLSTSPATITLDCPTVYFVLHAKVNKSVPAGTVCPPPTD